MAGPGGARLSTVDLFTGAFILLVGPDGADWAAAARTAAASLDIALDIHIGVELREPEDRWLDAYGVTTTGASLIRPDGFVAWRASTLRRHPEHVLQQVLTQLLARDHGQVDGVLADAPGAQVTRRAGDEQP